MFLPHFSRCLSGKSHNSNPSHAHAPSLAIILLEFKQVVIIIVYFVPGTSVDWKSVKQNHMST